MRKSANRPPVFPKDPAPFHVPVEFPFPLPSPSVPTAAVEAVEKGLVRPALSPVPTYEDYVQACCFETEATFRARLDFERTLNEMPSPNLFFKGVAKVICNTKRQWRSLKDRLYWRYGHPSSLEWFLGIFLPMAVILKVAQMVYSH